MVTKESIEQINSEQTKNIATNPETKQSEKGLIHSIFRTKGRSFVFFLFIAIIDFFLEGKFASVFPILGGFLSLFPILLLISLNFFGYKKEAKNAFMAIGMLLLAVIILAIIGFGICVFMLIGISHV